MMGIFSIFVEISKSRYDNPTMDTGSCIGDIVINEDSTQDYRSPKHKVLEACDK
jgi:hypothetical protein